GLTSPRTVASRSPPAAASRAHTAQATRAAPASVRTAHRPLVPPATPAPPPAQTAADPAPSATPGRGSPAPRASSHCSTRPETDPVAAAAHTSSAHPVVPAATRTPRSLPSPQGPKYTHSGPRSPSCLL